MKFSETIIKTRKEKVKEIDSVNADLLIRANYIDQSSSGVYTLLPLGLRVLDKITDIIREEINSIGGQEISMTVLQPAEIWKKTERYDVPISFKTKSKTGQEYILGWTHEEAVTPIAKKIINSYRDLPLYLYQFQLKFRDELRPKSGLLRTREFLMKDLYSFHTDEKDLDSYYQKAKKAYENIFNRMGLGGKTVYTYASGGEFSKYSHEFQTICEVGEDIIYVCEKCKVAINKEIIHEGKNCPECGNKKLTERKAVEVGNIFKLGTRYSRSFDLSFQDRKGIQSSVVMGSYGIGLNRLLGTIVELYHDENGIIWPGQVAPYAVCLVSLGEDDAVIKQAQKIYEELSKKNIDVLWDDRTESAGVKLADADLIGIPVRIVVSEKTINRESAELKLRNKNKTELVRLSELIKVIQKAVSNV